MNAAIIALVTAFAVPLGNASLLPNTDAEGRHVGGVTPLCCAATGGVGCVVCGAAAAVGTLAGVEAADGYCD